MTTSLASHLKRKKRDGPASSLINSLKCSLLKERINNRKGKRAGQVRGFCNEHSFNIARGLRTMEALSNEFPSYEPPYVTKKTDALLRVWGSAASFVFPGGCAKIWISQTKGPEEGHRNQKFAVSL